MATYKPSIAFYSGSDTDFRAWISAIKTALVTNFGWTQTADTGQLNPATVTYPVGANVNKGYLIFAMGDSLQGTYPVYLRFEFGSTSSGGTNYPALCIQAGSATDGAGTLTGTFGPKFIATAGFVSSATATAQHFAGNSSGFVGLLRNGISASLGLIFFCERLYASDGTPSSNGVFYGIQPLTTSETMGASGPSYGGCQVLEWGVAVPPAWVCQFTGLSIGPSTAGPTTVPTTSTTGGNTYLFPVIPIGWRAWNPSPRLFAYYSADVASNTSISSSVYGTTRSILTAGIESTAIAGGWGLTNDYASTNNNVKPAIADY